MSELSCRIHSTFMSGFLKGAYPVDGTQVRMQTLRLNEDWVDIDLLNVGIVPTVTYRILHRLNEILDGINRLAPTPDRQYDRIVLLLRDIDVLKLSKNS